MNGSPSTNKGVIFVVVVTLAFNASVGLLALGYCLVQKIEPDKVLLTAFINIIIFLFGVIGGMLTKTSPTEATKTPLDSPAPVTVVNAPSDPVPTVETN